VRIWTRRRSPPHSGLRAAEILGYGEGLHALPIIPPTIPAALVRCGRLSKNAVTDLRVHPAAVPPAGYSSPRKAGVGVNASVSKESRGTKSRSPTARWAIPVLPGVTWGAKGRDYRPFGIWFTCICRASRPVRPESATWMQFGSW
jgi:hypothetical protein